MLELISFSTLCRIPWNILPLYTHIIYILYIHISRRDHWSKKKWSIILGPQHHLIVLFIISIQNVLCVWSNLNFHGEKNAKNSYDWSPKKLKHHKFAKNLPYPLKCSMFLLLFLVKSSLFSETAKNRNHGEKSRHPKFWPVFLFGSSSRLWNRENLSTVGTTK